MRVRVCTLCVSGELKGEGVTLACAYACVSAFVSVSLARYVPTYVPGGAESVVSLTLTARRLGCGLAAINDPRRNLAATWEEDADFADGACECVCTCVRVWVRACVWGGGGVGGGWVRACVGGVVFTIPIEKPEEGRRLDHRCSRRT